MRSLRFRFFLISWPIVVAAVLLVALGVERWVSVEFVRLDRSGADPQVAANLGPVVDSLAVAWPAVISTDGASMVVAMAGRFSSAGRLVVVDSLGNPVASTGDGIRITPISAEPGGLMRFENGATDAVGRTVTWQAELNGWPIARGGGRPLGFLYLLPPPAEGADAEIPPWRVELRRTLWKTGLIASLAAAVASLLLAGPLVRRLTRLGAAASAIRAGTRDVRVPDDGSDEIGQLGQAFNAMSAALDQAETHKRNLVIDVAHELRTPLTNILGSVEAMQDGLREPDPQALASLRDEAGLLAALVAELQELSLAESGQLVFDLEPMDAVMAAKSAVEAVRDVLDGVILVGPEEQATITVCADARRLGQVLRNLLRNALTHTPAGGRIWVEVEARKGVVVFQVSDTGRGIPAAHLPLVWERFHRVDPSRGRASGGMGLGLALVRQLVEQMHGRVSVESPEGGGSVFRVELPSA